MPLKGPDPHRNMHYLVSLVTELHEKVADAAQHALRGGMTQAVRTIV